MIEGEVPGNGYWKRTGNYIFTFPLVTVFAKTKELAYQILEEGYEGDVWDGMAYIDMCLSSIEAQGRLGTFGTGKRVPGE